MTKRRVVVTGIGAITPLATNASATWKGLLEGRSGIRELTSFDTSAFSTRFGGSIPDFDHSPYISSKEAKFQDLFIQYGMAAGIQAVDDSGIDFSTTDPTRCGAAIGSGIGGISSIEAAKSVIDERGPRRMSPFFVPGSIINMIAGNLAMKYCLKGPNVSVVTACTTGTHNIGMAARTIQYGDADVMLAGGAEMATTHVGLGGFAAARALSTRNDDPTAASRPWDRDRDGFVLSDGAGVVVLEELDHARQRGAKIYAELVGFGMSDDAYHMTSPPADGEGAARSMLNALNDARLDPSTVDYINAHGTSTKAGDLAEAMAVKAVLKSHAENAAVSSTKSMIGHLLGAAGAVEAIFSVLAIRDQVAPPTINLQSTDVDLGLNFVPNHAQARPIEVAMSNSFGFGGTNGTLVFKRFDD
ncbi:MAG: beta-ketoacyl-ACP synthase II [Gammaproteobacteria bacterium]|nr:beta-ketoacyl-ACP synthase II [Gammaproteobacteria bacterium]